MPPRPPPTPGILAVLCSVAALAATWAAVAADQVVRGLAGAMMGVPFGGVAITRRYLVGANTPLPANLGPGGLAFVILSGAVALVILAWALYAFVQAARSSGWFRGLVLGWFVVALLWLPAALIVAALPGGSGPVQELYGRLGPPMAGRWTALALGILCLWLAAAGISRCAVALGRGWMRVDAVEFRRRMVRRTAGWPAVTVLLALSYIVGWAPTWWALSLPVAALTALHFQTR